ncbi:hypothetical protein MNBD_NITROSPINAE01-1816, partial [hydrothermal vent metagenome]
MNLKRFLLTALVAVCASSFAFIANVEAGVLGNGSAITDTMQIGTI